MKQAGCRIHHQRCTSDDHHVRLRNRLDCTFDYVLVQRLLIKNHIRFNVSAAGAVRHASTMEDILRSVKLVTLFAVIAQHTAVQLKHVFAACLLVQTIDVLCNNSGQLASLLQLRQLFMRGIGLGIQIQHFIAVELEKLLRTPFVERMAEDGFRRILIGLMV